MLYLEEIVENQGKLFDYVSQEFKDKDTEDFISAYMISKTRAAIDACQAYVCTMDYMQLWEYFTKTEVYRLKAGKALGGFMPRWIGEFYAYYQKACDISSVEVIKKLPLAFMKNAYAGLHDLDFDLVIKKINAA